MITTLFANTTGTNRSSGARSARLPTHREAGHTSTTTPKPSPQITRPDAAAVPARTEARRASLDPRRKQPLGKMPDSFAKRRYRRVEQPRRSTTRSCFRPAAGVAGPRTSQSPPEAATAAPAGFREDVRGIGSDRSDPDRDQERRRSEQQTGKADQQHPGYRELRQADFREQAARQRQASIAAWCWQQSSSMSPFRGSRIGVISVSWAPAGWPISPVRRRALRRAPTPSGSSYAGRRWSGPRSRSGRR